MEFQRASRSCLRRGGASESLAASQTAAQTGRREQAQQQPTLVAVPSVEMDRATLLVQAGVVALLTGGAGQQASGSIESAVVPSTVPVGLLPSQQSNWTVRVVEGHHHNPSNAPLGTPFYINQLTGDTTWTHPAQLMTAYTTAVVATPTDHVRSLVSGTQRESEKRDGRAGATDADNIRTSCCNVLLPGGDVRTNVSLADLAVQAKRLRASRRPRTVWLATVKNVIYILP